MPAGKVKLMYPGKLSKDEKTQVKKISYNQAKKYVTKTAEKNYWQVQPFNATGISTTAVVTDLTNVTQATDVQNDQFRRGDKLSLVSFQYRYHVLFNDSTNLLRVVFFQWMQDDTPDHTEIFQWAAFPLYSTFRQDTQDHYKILYDRTHAVNTYKPQEFASGSISRAMKKIVRYDAGTAVGQNKVYVLAVSDSGVVSHPSLSMITRMNYMDL